MYQLRNIGFITKYLTYSATKKLVHALISSRLDFGNALFMLLFNLPQIQLSRLQKLLNAAARILNAAARILNAAARITNLSKKYINISPNLQLLQWLQVSQVIVLGEKKTFRFLRLSNSASHVLPKPTKKLGSTSPFSCRSHLMESPCFHH